MNAAGVSIDELNLKVGDRLCYLFDYADERRFYLILKKIFEDESSQKEPVIVKGKGETFRQCAASRINLKIFRLIQCLYYPVHPDI